MSYRTYWVLLLIDEDFPECEEKDVLNAITGLADKKVSILAVQLGIEKPQLDDISCCSMEMRKSKLAELWFRHTKDKPPTWASLLNALKAPSMQEDWLADYIQKKYVEREREVISMNTDNDDFPQFSFSQQQPEGCYLSYYKNEWLYHVLF